MRIRFILALAVVLAAAAGVVRMTWRQTAVLGSVVDSHGRPLAGATVRIKTASDSTRSRSDGSFALSGFEPAFRLHVTAWLPGYYVGGAVVPPWDTDAEIVLSRYTDLDHPGYVWQPPQIEGRSTSRELWVQAALGAAARISVEHAFLPLAERMTLGCRDCHGSNLYDQWESSAHAQGTRNRRFMTMYNGTDVLGRRGRESKFRQDRLYGSTRARPDPDQPDYGPGFKLDYPDLAGNCATCHLPSAAINEPYGVDPNQVAGVDALGSHCDFCHKIVDVQLDPASGLPYENLPGILSMVFLRPAADHQLFFGPYDDVDVGPDSYLPLMRESQICAPCHSGSFWGVPIYQSFPEWLASPYAAAGKTCQSCHMKPDGVTTNFAPGRGGLQRRPESIPTHDFPGTNESLLRAAVSMTLTAERRGEELRVEAEITNDQTGHHVPTGSPLRHLILLVRATGGSGALLTLEEGPTLPDWCGVGDPAAGRYAGLPGTAYAKLLQEMWSESIPSGGYWVPTRIVQDNRIAAMQSASSSYLFMAPPGGAVRIEARLIYRRAFVDLMDKKGWTVPDVVMAQRTLIAR